MNPKRTKNPDGEIIVVDHIDVTMPVGLRDKVAEAADRDGKPMTQWVRELLATHFNDPSLARMPRAGRPRREERKSNGHRRQAS